MSIHWRPLGDGLYATDLIVASPAGVVLDMFSLSAAPWATALFECVVTVTVSNLAGTEILVLSAGPLYAGADSAVIVGFPAGGFTEVRREGWDLILVQGEDVPDKVFSSDGGQFLATAEIVADTLA